MSEKKFPKLPIELEPIEELPESDSTGKAGKEAEAAGGEPGAARANFVPPVNAEAGRAGAGDAVTGEESRRGGKPARNTETSEARSGVSPEA